MSFNPLPDIKDCWSSKIFVGNSVFSKFQSRDARSNARHNVEFHPVLPDSAEHALDPLRHSKYFGIFFNKGIASIAYYSGVLSLGKLTMACDARSRAWACLPMKPDPRGLRFCSLSAAGTNCPPCSFSTVINGLGNFPGGG